jgi:hypothetical protein
MEVESRVQGGVASYTLETNPNYPNAGAARKTISEHEASAKAPAP